MFKKQSSTLQKMLLSFLVFILVSNSGFSQKSLSLILGFGFDMKFVEVFDDGNLLTSDTMHHHGGSGISAEIKLKDAKNHRIKIKVSGLTVLELVLDRKSVKHGSAIVVRLYEGPIKNGGWSLADFLITRRKDLKMI